MSKKTIYIDDQELESLVYLMVDAHPWTLRTSEVRQMLLDRGVDVGHTVVLRHLEYLANMNNIGFTAIDNKTWGWYSKSWIYGGGNL